MKLQALLLAALLITPALADEAPRDPIVIERAWARSTVPGVGAGGAFLTLKNRGAADQLVGASTPVAASVQLHQMSHEGDVMRMRQVATVELPAGQTVELRPGGLHLMLFGLKSPLRVGTHFALTLRFARAGERTVEVAVEPVATGHDALH